MPPPGHVIRNPATVLLCLLSCLVATTPAFAHASDRGHVMLLPTGYYVVAGACAVALSFLLLAFAEPRRIDRLARARRRILTLPFEGRLLSSLLSFGLLAALVAAGFWGSRDPLSNPLPLFVWTIFWVGLVLVQGLVGNAWHWLDPWYAPWRLVTMMLKAGRGGIVALPSRVDLWPAFFGLSCFAWFELIDAAPDDPARLAAVVAVYWAATFALMLVFGFERWSRSGEFLTVFMGMVSKNGVLARSSGGSSIDLRLNLPGARLAEQDPLTVAGTAFLLLALASVSFDGFMRTFSWLALVGINPLEFPGRSAVMVENTVGLLSAFIVLAGAFHLAVAAGERMAGSGNTALAAGALVWSIMPISLAFHFSHYLTSFVVNGQYAMAAASDPFATGRDLFGTSGYQVSAGSVLGAESAWIIWNVQAIAIILGHVLAVASAHLIAWRRHGSARAATLSQIPVAILMVTYTVFGLWLLSTPTGY